ncbi:MAG TPA: DegQ family serine endoprotease [Chthoniobacterales bacterium]|nr:DegQ family serine endoprotease [Chthoniobacterales bacterium]
MNAKQRTSVWVAAMAGAALVTSVTVAFSAGSGNDNSQKPPLSIKTDNVPIDRDPKLGNSFAPIVQKVIPSVVQVDVTGKSGNGGSLGSSDMQDQLRRFFGRGFQIPEQPEMPNQKALGSGVIISADGYILTNNHVVENSKTIQVTLSDGRKLTAKVIGTDPQTDVALLKVEATNLEPITLADSDSAQVGDVVLAIGDPFGLGTTVTEGIISAKNRTRVTSGDADEDFIQTDAAINPGNSGGALVDIEGRLIGINASILSRSGGNQGIGFAVPSNLCRWVADSLITKGKVERGYLGVHIQTLTPELAKAFNSNRVQGAVVIDVSPNSAAEQAGFKSGDVVVEFNNRPIESADQLKLQVAETPPGSAIPVQVDRNGQVMSFNVTLKELNSDALAKNEPNVSRGEHDALTGVEVTNLDRDARDELKVPNTVRGTLITQVEPSSPAYEAGLRENDVILEVNRQPIQSTEDFTKATTGKGGSGETLVKVWNQNGTHYVAVQEGNG